MSNINKFISDFTTEERVEDSRNIYTGLTPYSSETLSVFIPYEFKAIEGGSDTRKAWSCQKERTIITWFDNVIEVRQSIWDGSFFNDFMSVVKKVQQERIFVAPTPATVLSLR